MFSQVNTKVIYRAKKIPPLVFDFAKHICDNHGMDWKNIIEDLQESGMTQAEIGEAIGKSQAWVCALAKGQYSDVRWSDGEALRKLHDARCKSRKAA